MTWPTEIVVVSTTGASAVMFTSWVTPPTFNWKFWATDWLTSSVRLSKACEPKPCVKIQRTADEADGKTSRKGSEERDAGAKECLAGSSLVGIWEPYAWSA